MPNNEEISERTFGNEERLPKVPLPTVAQSCARLLEWCAPLLSAEQLARTRSAVDEFLAPDSPAHALQEALREFDARADTHSWLDEFWPYRYLGRRDRIALNANFFFLFQESPLGQLRRAAELIAGAVAYKLALDDERIPPAVQRGAPQSMVQHAYLFSATRIPGVEQDTTRTPYTDDWPGPSAYRHIVVFSGGRMFALDVLTPEHTPYTVDDLVGALREIAPGSGQRPAHPVGHLTTRARAEWAADRQALLDLDPANAAALDTVETALFCVCLDDVTPTDDTETCAHLLHGDSGNRWFDKAVSLIVLGDGSAGINIEHCGLDGTTILNFTDALLGDGGPAVAAGPDAGTPPFAPVRFELDDGLRTGIERAAASFAEFASDTATTLLSYPDFGAQRAKGLRMSPDAFVQLAYQLAHRRAKGMTGATYESIATRQFRHGRTEAMRVITPEMLDFVAAMDDPAAGREARTTAARAAAEKHVARAKECQQGEAPEQHLWELALIQQRRGAELGAQGPLALYDSPGWQIMRDDYLSTSSAPSVHIRYFGFGSTSPQCIGVAYVLLPDRLNIHLSTPRAVSEQMHAFAEALTTAIHELDDLLSDA